MVSPDGRHIAFAADADGKRLIWIRPLDSLEARPLPGTDGVLRPVLVARQPVPRVHGRREAEEGRHRRRAAADDLRRAQRRRRQLEPGRRDPLRRTRRRPAVAGAGGRRRQAARRVWQTAQGEGTPGAGWPEFLPDGKHFLFTIGDSADMTLMVGALDSKETKTLFKTTSRVQYAEPGYLLFVRERTLVAQKFDAELADAGRRADADWRGARLRRSRPGVVLRLAQRRARVPRGRADGHAAGLDRSRRARKRRLFDAPADYRDASLSPDGTRLAYDVSRRGTGQRDVWIRDLARGVSSRFTFDAGAEVNPHWSPDGRRIVFTLARQRAGRPVSSRMPRARGKRSRCWSRPTRSTSPTGRATAATSSSRVAATGDNGWDMLALPIDGDRKPFAIAKTKFNELWATFSPDGKYVAYQSNESGRSEIYVHEFPEARNKWQVSTEGGTEPFWRGDGRELFYRAGTARDGGARADRQRLHRRHACEAVRDAVCGGHRARALSADAGRPAFPRARAAGAR